MFDNHGQSCCAGSRTYVQSKIYDEFVRHAKNLAARRIVGDPFDVKTEQGPQIDQEQFDKVINLIKSGIQEKATLEIGGERNGNVGFFIKVII